MDWQLDLPQSTGTRENIRRVHHIGGDEAITIVNHIHADDQLILNVISAPHDDGAKVGEGGDARQ
eukprot:2083768-Prorocentrum_lima.AAC.1